MLAAVTLGCPLDTIFSLSASALCLSCIWLASATSLLSALLTVNFTRVILFYARSTFSMLDVAALYYTFLRDNLASGDFNKHFMMNYNSNCRDVGCYVVYVSA